MEGLFGKAWEGGEPCGPGKMTAFSRIPGQV